MMAISGISDITIVTLGIALMSLVLVIVSITIQRGQRVEHHNEGKELEVSAVVSEFSQRMKRMEENLVDQKVRLEILDLRLNRSHNDSREGIRERADVSDGTRSYVKPTVERTSVSFTTTRPPQTDSMDKKEGSTELEALRIVYESQGRATAKDIQRRIGRTREHTSRMMNGLFQSGLVQRDISVRPFSYSITQKGIDLLSS